MKSDSEFESWLLQQLCDGNPSLYEDYTETFEAATSAIVRWRRRFHGNPGLWKRLFDKERVRKEFTEAVPIIDAVVRLVTQDTRMDAKFTIVDLASGKGYLSMLLSEMLPPCKVEQCILMDKAWPAHNVTPQPHHINSEHIYGKYYRSWPIHLVTSKQDFKSARQRRALQKLFFQSNRVILLAVHLCGTLALKAVDFFNHNASIEFFSLKPCCLPGTIHSRRNEIFFFAKGEVSRAPDHDPSVVCHPCYHSFQSATVCMHGKWNKNVWKGPHRSTMTNYFHTWAHNLFLGIGVDDNEGGDENPAHDKYQQGAIATKLQTTVLVQTDGGYQNEFLFAQRGPTTESVWTKLHPTATTVAS